MIRLVHVNKIEKIAAVDLGNVTKTSDSSCKLLPNVNFASINNIYGLIAVKMENAVENGNQVYTTTVTYNTSDKKPGGRQRLAFRLTSVHGTQFLVGTNERPYPVVKESNPFPAAAGDTVLKTVTITWKAPMPMLRIL